MKRPDISVIRRIMSVMWEFHMAIEKQIIII